MGRRYEDAVHVQQAPGAAASPSAFLWHERLYVIREVLGHWYERTSWWEGAGARAVRGEEAASPPAGTAALDPGREVWRVAASAGRHGPTGTYDLSRSGAGATGWRLLQVVD